MCKVGGGPENRCDTHKDGSKATIKLTTLISNVHEKVVRTVFKDLKKEGKGLPAPEKDEVVGYNNTGIWLTKHNANIPDRQKQTIMNQFERAKEEKPSGPLFHAWKHTMPEVMRRTRKTLMATGLAGALVLTSACAGSNGGNIDSTPTNSPTSISAPATPSPVASASATPGSVINGIPTKKELGSDANGEYIQTTIAPDDPAFTYDPAVVESTATERFSPEEIKEAHRVAVEYSVEAIDSPMNGSAGDKETVDKWWAANKDRFDPSYQAEIYNDAVSNDPNKPVVYKGTHRDGYGLQYGSDVTHITNRDIQTTKIHAGELNGRTAIAVSLQSNFSSAVEVDGKKAQENTVGMLRYTLVKDPASGKFLITGYFSEFSIQPVR